jgi:hypothetical protein
VADGQDSDDAASPVDGVDHPKAPDAILPEALEIADERYAGIGIEAEGPTETRSIACAASASWMRGLGSWSAWTRIPPAESWTACGGCRRTSKW